MANLENLSQINYGKIGRIETQTTTDTQSVLESSTPVDMAAPRIAISGPSTITLTQGDIFVMPSMVATDEVDGLLEVIVEGVIDTTKLGTQTLNLKAKDRAGNISTRILTVIIKAPEITPKDIQIQGLSDVVQLDQSGSGEISFQVSGADAGDISTNDIAIA